MPWNFRPGAAGQRNQLLLLVGLYPQLPHPAGFETLGRFVSATRPRSRLAGGTCRGHPRPPARPPVEPAWPDGSHPAESSRTRRLVLEIPAVDLVVALLEPCLLTVFQAELAGDQVVFQPLAPAVDALAGRPDDDRVALGLEPSRLQVEHAAGLLLRPGRPGRGGPGRVAPRPGKKDRQQVAIDLVAGTAGLIRRTLTRSSSVMNC